MADELELPAFLARPGAQEVDQVRKATAAALRAARRQRVSWTRKMVRAGLRKKRKQKKETEI